MIPVRNFLDQTVASPAKSVEMRAGEEEGGRDRCFMMVYGESIWLVLRGGGWVRLGASRFWSVCRIR